MKNIKGVKETNLAYIAGIIDGEGSIYLGKAGGKSGEKGIYLGEYDKEELFKK